MTCGWGCTGCGWRASSPRSAPPARGSPWPRGGRRSAPPGARCRARGRGRVDGRPRAWFRYHQRFADLLQLELRHSEPAQILALHGTAAGWFAGHGYPVEAVRHAQAAQDWGLAARLLADHWLGLVLNGQGATAYELFTRFPAGAVAADAELIALMAAGGLTWGSAEGAARYPRPAARGVRGGGGPVPGAPARR